MIALFRDYPGRIFFTPIARDTLGKGMKVMIPDEYSIRPGFEDGPASAAWLQQEQDLAGVRQQFGQIYALLVAPQHIQPVEADRNGQFKPLHEQLKTLSREYFAMKQRHARGENIAVAELQRQTAALQSQYAAALK